MNAVAEHRARLAARGGVMPPHCRGDVTYPGVPVGRNEGLHYQGSTCIGDPPEIQEHDKYWRSLCASMIYHAVIDIRSGDRKLVDNVMNWVHGTYTSIMPFETCCRALDRDPGVTRMKVLREAQ